MAIADIGVIKLAPQELDLRLYAGDGALVRLTFTQDQAAIPMDNGEVTAQIRLGRLDPDPVCVWTVDGSQAEQGIIVLSLTGEQTAEFLQATLEHQTYGWRGAWDVQWNPTDGEPVTLFHGACYCDADVTR